MNIKSIKTNIITENDDILNIVQKYITTVKDYSVLAVSSKIVSLTEGSYIEDWQDKDAEIIKQSQMYLPRVDSKYKTIHTITKGTNMLAAGIDESNANGKLITWPKDPLNTARLIRNELISKHNLNNFGVIIVDSTSRPFRIGAIGTSLASCGINEIKDYRGAKDLFAKTIDISQQNVVEALASTSVLAMGEGTEQTPMCLIDKPINVTFDAEAYATCYEATSKEYLLDVYEPFWKAVDWQIGGDS